MSQFYQVPEIHVAATINDKPPRDFPKALDVFVVASERVNGKFGSVDSGLKEGTLVTKSAVVALYACMLPVAERLLTDKKDKVLTPMEVKILYKNIDWSISKQGDWATESAKEFVSACVRTMAKMEICKAKLV